MSEKFSQDVFDYIDKIADDFQNQQKELARLLDIEVVFEGLKKLEDPEVLVKSYAEAVQRYNDICKVSSHIALQQYNLKIARRVVTESGLPGSLQEKLRRRIDSMMQEFQYLKESSFELRNGYDSGTRFYSSIQYILSSPRLGGYGA